MKAAVAIAAVGMSAFAASVAQAQNSSQNKKPAATQNEAIAPEALGVLNPKLRQRLDSLEDRARKIVGQQLSDGRFLLFVKSEVNREKFLDLVNKKAGTTRLTTLPMTLSAAEKQKLVAETLSVQDVALISGPVSITITFDSEIPDGQTKALRDAVADALEISTQRGDSVIVKKAPIMASVNTKMAEGAKDLEKLRFEVSAAQQKLAQLENERMKLNSDLESANSIVREEREKIRKLEDDLSIYKTPLGEVKKLIKGLELPLTILPIAVLLFVFAAAGFFVYLRFQGAKTNKLMQAADVMAQAFAKAGRQGGAGAGLTLDAARAEMTKLIASQNDDASRNSPNMLPQALLSEEIASTKQEALDAWADLKKYPYLTFTELREWLVGGGAQTQRFMALANALGPVESMRLFQQFSHQDLAAMRSDSIDNASKLPGYAAILQLHRNVTAEVIRKPPCVAELDFPELIRANDGTLAHALAECAATTVALCINLLPQTKRRQMLEMLSPETQAQCVEGMAIIANLDTQSLEQQVVALKEELRPKLANTAAPKLGAEDAMADLLNESSPKVRAVLQESLSKHEDFKNTLLQKMVTFEDVLELDNETLTELLDELEPEQMAVLVCGLNKEAQNRIAGILPRKVVVTIQGELQRLNTRQALLRRAQAQSLELQAALAEKLKGLVSEGIVDLKRGDKGASTTAIASSGGEAKSLEQGQGQSPDANATEETA